MPWGISKKHKVIFIHIPKTAGCAICELMKPVMSVQSNHATIDEIKSWYYASPNSPYRDGDRIQFEQYRPFAVVRNPYDRFALGFFYTRGKRVYRDTSEANIQKLAKKMTSLRTQKSWVNDTCRLLKYENLENDLNAFFGETGVLLDAKNMKVVHAIGIKEVFDDYYTADLKMTVRKLYEPDFNLWEQLR